MSLTLFAPGPRGIRPSQAGSVEALFMAWYREYPRKVAVATALKAYRFAIRKTMGMIACDEQTAAAVLVEGLRRHRFSPDPKYIPHPATWLNGMRWMDQPDDQGMDPVLKAAGLTEDHIR